MRMVVPAAETDPGVVLFAHCGQRVGRRDPKADLVFGCLEAKWEYHFGDQSSACCLQGSGAI